MSEKKSVIFHLRNHLGVAILGKISPIFAIFVYTQFMSPRDYGVINLYSSYLVLISVLLVLNLHTAIGRYIYSKDIDYPKFISMTIITVTALSLFFFILVAFNLNFFAELISLPKNVTLFMGIIAYGTILEMIFIQILIFKEKSSLLLKLNSIKALSLAIISLVLLFMMNKNQYMAIIIADLLIFAIFSIYILKFIWKDLYLVFDRQYFKLMCIYSIPLIPYMLSLTLLSQSDRILINYYHDKSQTGLYSLAYNVGMMLGMVMTAVLNAINPSYYQNMYEKNYLKVLDDSNAIFYIAIILTLCNILFGIDIVALVVSSKYADSFIIIPLVALGGLCSALFQIWVRAFAYVNKTYIISLISVGMTILNIGLNLLLIPTYGYKIAALTTFISYFGMAIVCMLIFKYYLKIFEVNILKQIFYILLLGGIYLVFINIDLNIYIALSLKLFILVLFIFHFKNKIMCLFKSNKLN